MEATPVFDTCLNCQNVFEGKYCNRCGQKAQHRRLPIKALLHDVMHDVFHFEHKIFGTLWKLITKPGFLTVEYLEGRRAKWYPPFRLFLVMSGLFMFVLSPLYQDFCGGFCEGILNKHQEIEGKVSPKNQSTTFDKNHPNNESKRVNTPKVDEISLSNKIDTITNKTTSYITKLPFFLMPAFAALLYLFDRRKNKLFFDNLILSMHHHAFSSIIIALTLPVEQLLLGTTYSDLTLTIYLITIAYLAMSLRVVTGQGWIASIFKSTLISLIYISFIIATFGATLGTWLALME